MSIRFGIVCAMISLGCCVSSSPASDDATRTVTATITVVDEEGRAIEGLGLVVGAGGEWPCNLATDAAGRASCALTVLKQFEELNIQPGATPPAPGSLYPTSETMQKSRELKRRYSLQQEYRIRLTPADTEYALEIRARAAITVSGRLVSPDGTPLSGNIWDRKSWAGDWLRSPHQRAMEIKGVARGEPAELMFLNDGYFVMTLPLTAEQTAADLDLGDVVLQPISGVCPVRVRIEPRKGMLITLVNANTGQVFGSIVNKEGFAVMRYNDEEGIMSVPAGKYYVVAGGFVPGDHDGAYQLLDLVRAGRAEAHPELPSFVASPEQEAAVTIDPKETLRKIRAAAKAEAIPEGP